MNNEFDVAIVGMAGRFPGARDLDEFWKNLAGGVESITRFSDEEMLQSGVPAAWLRNPNYVKAAPVLAEPGQFDAAFFGFSPSEAKSMDPQHRILLELAYEAFEHAGYDTGRYQGRVGVFTGAAMNTYFMNAGLGRRFAEEYIPTLIGNDKDFLSTRISYKLNLKGPSITVQTACSSSMVAVHLARQSLLSQETDMALAGAISVRVPHRAGYFCDAGGVVSPDGHVRAFDAKANGTVFGSGGGILLLKRLADALADGDTIHAVIKGSAVNNDGSEKAGYTAPSVNSQADAVVEALSNAGIEADDISYVEAHGSGTPVGDPIEVSALTKAFRTFTQRSGYCAIGSVKTNVGHLDAAAAVTGILKTVLALKHRQLPPSLHFSEPNSEIDLARTPFYVNKQLQDWPGETPPRAAVMSTGMGGTNACVILEAAPERASTPATHTPHLLILSAKTEAALEQATRHLQEFLKRSDADLGNVAYTLQMGRKAFPHRRFLVCHDREDLSSFSSSSANDSRRPLLLLLPGIGDQYAGMAYDLYETWPVFRQDVDRCAQILEPHLGIDIRSIIYPKDQSWKQSTKGIDLRKMLGPKTATPLNQTRFAQPALFTIEYAMTRLWQSLGITPDAIVGHSMGEYVAACLAGVMPLEDALRLVATRAKLVNELPQGAMLAVTLPESELLPLLPEGLSISLINGPRLCVMAGPVADIADFEKLLNEKGIICRRVQNAHAFHSRMLDPIVKAFEEEVKKVQLREPTIPYISNVTGTWIKPSEATSAAYWARHATRTARFADALRELWQFKDPILLEAGPGRTLGVLAMQHPERNGGDPIPISSIRHHYENQSDIEFLLQAIGKLWAAGAVIKWENLHRDENWRRIPLPTYPFERQNYWLDPKPIETQCETRSFEDWFYVPSWKRSDVRSSGCLPSDAFWLILSDRQAHLDRFGFVNRVVRLDEQVNYLKLFEEIQKIAPRTINIVHFGSCQESGFHSLLQVAQAISELNLSLPISIGIITSQIHEVTGEEQLAPEMATVLGPCGVIPKEFPNIKCFNVDLSNDNLTDEVITRIVSEFADPTNNNVIAYRGRYRWERDFTRVKLPKMEVGRLKRGGVYVITGGTGGIGLAISKYLTQVCQPKIILTKKSAFPEKSQWRELRATHLTIRTLLEIEELGAEIDVQVAEVSDAAQMQKVFDYTLQQYGSINGVIHAAGIVKTGVILGKTRATVESVLAPKVQGTMILFDLIKDLPLDFVVLFSSMTSIETPYAQFDYSAANAFLDAFTYAANARHKFPTLTINWPGWKEVGLLANLEMPLGMEGWKEDALRKSITPRDGVEAFARALNSGLKQVIVSPENLDDVVARSRLPVDPAMYLSRPQIAHKPSMRARRTDNPTNEVEVAVAEIWSSIFGLDQIGIHENFSQLGGHSLLAMQIVAKVRALYEMRFTLREFFEAPTIAEMSSFIQARVLADIESLTDDQARRLVSA
jgi:acyl transferase domain-containing protein